MQLFNAEIPWIPCIPSVQGRGRVTGSSAADSSASKEASGRAGKPAGHPFGRRLYSSRAIRRLGCSVVRGSLRREMRTTVGGVGPPLKERECIEDLFLIIREMPLNTECRLIDYSRYAANTHSARAFSLSLSLSVRFRFYDYAKLLSSYLYFLMKVSWRMVREIWRLFLDRESWRDIFRRNESKEEGKRGGRKRRNKRERWLLIVVKRGEFESGNCPEWTDWIVLGWNRSRECYVNGCRGV